MITKLKSTIWALALLFSVASVLVLSSCGGDDPEPDPDPDPVVAPGVSYSATTVAVGSTGSIVAAVTGDAATYEITDNGGVDFVTVDATTGELSVAAESTTGVYSVVVKATNSAGNAEGTAEITIGVNETFDPTGKNLIWKYFMNNTEGITLLNLNLLDDSAPELLPIPTGWPSGWDTGAINPTDPLFPTYFAFTVVQEALMQVPGDDVCSAVEKDSEDKSVYRGDTLIVIVNPDLTLSTVCRKKSDENTTVTIEMGTSEISYANDGFVWTIKVVLQDVPLTIAITDASIQTNYLDPLHPHHSNPSMQGGTYDAIVGTVEQYMTPTDFNPDNYLSSIALLNVDVVLEILP